MIMDETTVKNIVRHEAKTQGFYGRLVEQLNRLDGWRSFAYMVRDENIDSVDGLLSFIETNNYFHIQGV